MKQLSKLAAAAAMAVGALAASPAMASNCIDALGTSCQYTGAGYIYTGALDSQINEATDVLHVMGSVNASFTDVWVFDLSPQGAFFSVNANFQPLPAGITNFTVTLYTNVTGSGCTIATAVGSSCSNTLSLNGPVVGSPGAGGNSFILPYPLAAGQYAFVVSGQATGVAGQRYSGQVSTSVYLPEPASLGLVGLALFGTALGLRRARKTA